MQRVFVLSILFILGLYIVLQFHNDLGGIWCGVADKSFTNHLRRSSTNHLHAYGKAPELCLANS